MKTFMKKVYDEILELKGNGGGPLTRDNHLVYIACPSSSEKWTMSEVDEYAKLASDAGLPMCSIDGFTNGIIRESRAAFICARNQPNMPVSDGILIVDFGSSTVDFTYYSSLLSKPIDHGEDLGAQRIEELILNDILLNNKLVKDDKDIQELCKSKRIRSSLLLSIRQAKENFYNSQALDNLMVFLNFQTLMGRDTAPQVIQSYSSAMIDNMGEMENYQTSVREAFVRFKDQFLNGKNVSSIFLTGGASRMEWVKNIAISVFGEVKFPKEIGDSSTTISRGIALAGRADVRTILLESSLLNEIAVPNLFAYHVKDDSAKEFARDAFAFIKCDVERFKNDNSYQTIDKLKDQVKDTLSRMHLESYVQRSYHSVICAHINNTLLPRINSLIREYNSPNVSIELPSSTNFSADNLTSYSWSVSKVVEVCFSEIRDWLTTKVAKVGVDIIATAVAVLENGYEFIFGKGDYVDLDEYWVEITDTSTHLSYSQRERVFDTFVAHESEIKQRIYDDVFYSDSYSFGQKLEESFKKDIRSFIKSAIKEARLMLD